MPRTRPLLLCVLLALSHAASAATLTAGEAKNHIGENATVCGVVAGTHYAEQTKGSPMFVNINKPYPDQPFTNRDLGRGSAEVLTESQHLGRQASVRHRPDHLIP